MAITLRKTAYNGASFILTIVGKSGIAPNNVVGQTLSPLGKIPGVSKIPDFLGIKSVIGLEAVTYSAFSVERVALKGQGSVYNRGFTPPILSFEPITLELWQSEYDSWVDMCGGIEHFINTSFDITLQFRTAQGVPMTKIEFLNCYPKKHDASHSTSSPEGLTTSVQCYVGETKHNGKGLLGDILANVLPSI